MTVLADGSTDGSVVEQETVSMRYIDRGEPVTELAKIVPLESGKQMGVRGSETRDECCEGKSWRLSDWSKL